MAAPNWVNRTLWTGDNLDVMRGMNSESVDLIYLDPPFNSNRTYAAPVGSKAAGASFKDAWTLSDLDRAWMGLIADKHTAMYGVLQAARLSHGKGMQSYLCMMAVRLMEMKRVLKASGSIYLHCDHFASHYLKLLMDSVFGRSLFRNEIIWKRSVPHNDSKGFGRVADMLLFYGSKINTNAVRVPLDPAYVAKFYRFKDDRGTYRTGPLTTKGLSGGGYFYDFHGHTGPWRYPQIRMVELEADGRIHLPRKPGGVPSSKLYLHENKGQMPSNIWTDIAPVQGSSKERTGYPTQKPLSLLNRIIEASSDPGDVVLDPFAGCATACVATDKLQRQWVGIDLSPKAVELVNVRLKDALGGLYHHGLVTTRTDIPKRTDIDEPINYREHKHELFGMQEGVCNGCRSEFPYRSFELDHIIPRARGGGGGQLRQLATAVFVLQPNQRRPAPGIPDSPAQGTGAVPANLHPNLKEAT